MTTLREIEKAIEQLPEADQRKLADWLDQKHLVVEASAGLGSIYDDDDDGESQILDA